MHASCAVVKSVASHAEKIPRLLAVKAASSFDLTTVTQKEKEGVPTINHGGFLSSPSSPGSGLALLSVVCKEATFVSVTQQKHFPFWRSLYN